MLSAKQSQCVCTLMPSPNFGERKTPIDMLLLHYTGMEDDAQALDWLCNGESEVSSHYFVHRDGRVEQLVDESMRAWHAGDSFWKGIEDINSCAIGVEIANAGQEPFSDTQIETLIALCKEIIDRYDIAPERVLGHSDVAPMRKSDPGVLFPWDILAKEGIGHWIAPEPLEGGIFFSSGDEGQPIQALQSMLALYGYKVDVTGVYDDQTEACVSAFQRHFRPEKVDGVADVSTITTLYKLSAMKPAL